MTQLSIQDKNLVITVEGADKLWALKSHLTIPLEHISNVSYQPEIAQDWWHGLRVLGSKIPGVLSAGTFYQNGGWVFWDVHNPDNTIVLELVDEGYQKLVIEVADPKAAMQDIVLAQQNG